MEVGWNICSIKHQVRLPMRSDRLLSLAYKSPTRGRSLEAFPSTDTRAPQTALQVSATPREASTPKVSHLRPRPGWVIQLEPRETGSRQAVPSCSSVWDRIDTTRWQRPPGKGSISTAGLFFFSQDRDTLSGSQLHAWRVHSVEESASSGPASPLLAQSRNTLQAWRSKGETGLSLWAVTYAGFRLSPSRFSKAHLENHFKITFYLTICHFTPTSEASCFQAAKV